MIKVSKILEFFIFVAVFFLCDYVYIFAPAFMKQNALMIRFFVGFLGVVLAVLIRLARDKKISGGKIYQMADRYLVIYSAILLFTMVTTILKYRYTLNQTLFVLAPYLYIYYTYPLIYIYSHDKQEFAFVSKIARVILAMLVIKTVCWTAHSFLGTTILEDLTFQYENWSRNGTVRMDGGCLLGLIFTYYWMQSYGKRSKRNRVVAVLILCFVMFVVQYRFQVIALCAAIFSCYWVSSSGKLQKRNKRIMGALAIVLFAVSGGASYMIDSFSTEGNYGGSTLVRLMTVSHYWQLLIDNKAVLGLGLLNQGNVLCLEMMARINEWGQSTWYYLSDIGILGGFYQFGLLSIPLYGSLFSYGWKAYKACLNAKNKNLYIFIAALMSYAFFSNFAMNIFDIQRAFALPFYLSIISFSYGKCLENKTSA